MNPSTKFKQILASLVFALGLISPPVFSESFTGGMPASPQPDSATMKTGLWVMYFYDNYTKMDQVTPLKDGAVGDPLTHLEFTGGSNDKVMGAYRAKGVAAHIRGFIHFEQTGVYTLKLQSNDGVDLTIGGVHLWNDPRVHSTRWSDPLEYEVTEAGWYDFKLDYFQNQGSSALTLNWMLPGSEEEVVVPPEAFAFNM